MNFSNSDIHNDEPVAIVGIGCRFPGANGVGELWQLLCEGRDAITEVPPERFDIDAYHDPTPGTPGKLAGRCGGFISEFDRFDAGFFSISPREAERMDIQQRLLLEVCWEALEDAGAPPDGLRDKRVGVFIGTLYCEYGDARTYRAPVESIDFQVLLGGTRSCLSGRISYVFRFRGPSITVDTACSSSLVALHLACHSLRSGESELAIVGGCNLVLGPENSLGFSAAKAFSPEGRCKSFDATASGLVRSDGLGVVILKRLSRAIADHDRIYAVVRGSSVNNDGGSSGSLATPSQQGQMAGLEQALRHANVEPASIDYVEAHATGTPTGDPVEANAISSVLCSGRTPDRPLLLGSIKSNIGHTEGAAGVAGLMKAALALHHRRIPPTVHFRTPNPRIDWSHLRVPVQPEAWPDSEDHPPRAMINSFGVSETNACVVLEAAPVVEPTTPQTQDHERPRLLALSARSNAALEQVAGRYAQRVANGGLSLIDLCHTANRRRMHLEHRAALLVRNLPDAREKLATLSQGCEATGCKLGTTKGTTPRIAFLFTGHGGQSMLAVRCLRAQDEVFRASFDACAALVGELVGWSLVDVLANGDENASEIDGRIVQVLLVATQVALVERWRRWGIVPTHVVGHSLGELAAAHAAGALTREQVIRLAVERALAVGPTLGAGGVLALGCSSTDAARLIEAQGERVALAGENSPSSSIVSGENAALAELAAQAEARGLFARRVPIDYAAHHPQMDGPMSDLQARLEWLSPSRPSVSMLSTVSGQPITDTVLDGSYWAQNLRQPVQFRAAFAALLASGCDVIIEISARSGLGTLVRQNIGARSDTPLFVSSLRGDDAPLEALLESLAALHCAGVELDWRAVDGEGGFVDLPTMAWQRQRAWLATPPRMASSLGATVADRRAGILGAAIEPASHPQTKLWQLELSQELVPFLADHLVQGEVVVPGAMLVELMLSAAQLLRGRGPCVLEDVRFERALFLPADRTIVVQLLASRDGARDVLELFGRSTHEEPWTRHARATLGDEDARRPDREAHDVLGQRPGDERDPAMFYQTMHEALSLDYGPAFRAIDGLWHDERQALAHFALPASARSSLQFHVHPSLLDAGLHASGVFATQRGTLMPVAIRRVHYHSPAPAFGWSHLSKRQQAATGHLALDIDLYAEDGTLVMHIEELDAQILASPSPRTGENHLSHIQWKQTPLGAPQTSLRGASCVLFADAGGTVDALAKQLRLEGARCVIVRRGSKTSGSDDEVSIAQPSSDAVRDLLSRIDMLVPDHVVFGWSLDLSVRDERPFDEPLFETLWAGLQLAVALPTDSPRCRLWFLTAGGAIEAPDGSPDPTQTPFWGTTHAVANERGLRCTHVDIGDRDDPVALEMLALAMTSECRENQLAFMHGTCWSPRLVPLQASGDPKLRVNPEGTHLITGGLGGIGLSIAGWLADRGARSLLLVSRRPPSPEAQQAIEALEARGVSVALASADVCDRRAIRRVIEDRPRPELPIRGVFHTAGILGGEMLSVLSRDGLRAVLAPKVVGGWNLHVVTRGMPLDFFVVTSSILVHLPQPGSAGYSSANSFLDGLVHYRRAQGLPALSINFGLWASVGGALDHTQELESVGILSTQPERALAGMQTALELGVPQALVARMDFDLYFAKHPGIDGWSIYRDMPRRSSARAAKTPHAAAGSLATLQLIIARITGIPAPSIDPTKPISRLGLDSLMSVELVAALQDNFGAQVPFMQLLRGATLNDLLELVDPRSHETGSVLAISAESSSNTGTSGPNCA